MEPLLKEGDELLISDDVSHVNLGDIVLFRDDANGEFVVHRVVSVMPLETKGDWSCLSESPDPNSIFAKVVGYKRNSCEIFFKEESFFIQNQLFFSKLLLVKFRPIRWFGRLGLIFNRPLLLS